MPRRNRVSVPLSARNYERLIYLANLEGDGTLAKVAEGLLAEKLDDAADVLGQQIIEASRRQGITPEQWRQAALAQFAEVSQKKRRQKGGDVGNSGKIS